MLSDFKLWFSSIIFMTKTLKWWLNIARWVKHIRTWFFDENDEIWATSLENSFHSYTLQVCAVCKRFYPVSVWLNNTTKESNHPKFGSHFHSIFVSLSLSLSLSLISNLNFFSFLFWIWWFGDAATYQKAEVLFQIGRFEEALVFYHTGVKQRPDMEVFQQGVRKAQEAIEVSLGGINHLCHSLHNMLVIIVFHQKITTVKFCEWLKNCCLRVVVGGWSRTWLVSFYFVYPSSRVDSLIPST